MFHGSKFEPKWTSFNAGVGSDDRFTPVCSAVLRSDGDLAAFARLYATHMIDKMQAVAENNFATSDMVAFYTEEMPAYVEVADIEPAYNAKDDRLSLTTVWKLKDGIKDRGRYYDLQQLVLVKFDRLLPQNVRVIMNYDQLPLNDESKAAAIYELPSLKITKPSKLEFVPTHPRFTRMLGLPNPKVG